MTEKQAIRLAKRGSSEGFAFLYSLYKPKVTRLCRRILKTDEAEDATEDVFVHLLDKIRMFEGRSTFSTWLHRVAANICLMKLRGRKTKPEATSESIDDRDFLGRPRTNSALHVDMARAIGDLPVLYRQTFVLCGIQGREAREVGVSLGTSAQNIKSRFFRAKRELRECLR